MRAPRASGGRPGVVLFATVLLIVLSGLVLATTILLARQAALVARVRADGVRARLAAASAVRAAFARWPVESARGLALLQENDLPGSLAFEGGAEGRASVRRLGGDAYLLLCNGRAGVARGSAAALVHVLSLRSFLPVFPAAIGAGGGRLDGGARVTVAPPDAPPAPWSAAACDPGAVDTLAQVFGVAPRPGVLAPAGIPHAGADVQGDPPFADGAPAPDSLGFGPLLWDMLADWADRVETGQLTLAPVTGPDGCDAAAAGNWGAPLDPLSSCAEYFPLVYAPGDLRLLGGAGQGVLVVRGSLDMTGDARFYGPILVVGNAWLGGGTAVRGALTAGTVRSAGEVEYSACAILRALRAAPGLGRSFREGRRLWLPAFRS